MTKRGKRLLPGTFEIKHCTVSGNVETSGDPANKAGGSSSVDGTEL